MDHQAKVALVTALGIQPRPLHLDNYAAILGHAIPGDARDAAQLDAAIRFLLEDDASFRRVLHHHMIMWDADPEMGLGWTSGTPPSTTERRTAIYDALGASPALRTLIAEHIPIYLRPDIPSVSEEFTAWYDDARQQEGWYWPRYREYLGMTEGWTPENLDRLDNASTRVLERLSDPTSTSPRPTRGLVVGYVQSGKTANMTAVIARAVDAGYRLIILLSGTTNVLRYQTQRRLDKQLLGTEMVNPGSGEPDEYANDDDYSAFQSYGSRPSELGSVDWRRITTSSSDVRQVHAHLAALEVVRADPSKPVYHPDNLARQPAVLIVAKKNPSVLSKLKKALEMTHDTIKQLPTIVLDDESDNASINTTRPSQSEAETRTRINGLIVDLLGQLPRAQYVGYTATPFANVFINPRDALDLFPKHFVISLPKPIGYMGAGQFHDIDDGSTDTTDSEFSNADAFIREVWGEDGLAHNLPSAIDAYVLSGAIKLFREDQTKDSTKPLTFKHHTMLIHTSSKKADHERDKQTVLDELKRAGYDGGDGMDRLNSMLGEFRPISKDRSPDLPFPDAFDDLIPYVGQTLDLLYQDNDPVLIVNSSEADPDFEQGRLWRILVGGNKLSRGYTVEGLTVSYFRRRTGSGDTLMQMGRWFGYRHGYSDLVRLYIGVDERGYDLRQAFEGLVQTEEEFRAELARYALVDGAETLKPSDLPPLVTSHVPWLAPTSPTKMWNAELTYINFGEQWHEPTLSAHTPADRTANEQLFKSILADLEWSDHELILGRERSRTLIAEAAPDAIRALVGDEYRWLNGETPVRHRLFLEFLAGTEIRDPKIERWIILAPQLRRPAFAENFTLPPTFSVKYRARVDGDNSRVNVYTEPQHKRLATYVVMGRRSTTEAIPNDALEKLHDSGKSAAVLLFYPARHKREGTGPITMGFAALCPKNEMPNTIQFQAHTKG